MLKANSVIVSKHNCKQVSEFGGKLFDVVYAINCYIMKKRSNASI